jgi:mannose-6-phosphate isomerase-like protein (cupin superfamily)
MTSQMSAKMEKKNVDNSPDETRSFDKGKLRISNVGGEAIGKFTFEPGWKWSTSVKPVVKTETCEQTHTGYIISGRMKVKMNDGKELEIGPGDAMFVPPGHDAWVTGSEPCVGIDFTGAKTYAKK